MEGKPIVKAYDEVTNKSLVLIESGMNPQIAPEGNYMVVVRTDAVHQKNAKNSKLVLMDVEGKELSELHGSQRLYWNTDYVLNLNSDKGQLNLYNLSNGSKIKSFNVNGIPTEAKIINGNIKLKTYKFDNSQVTVNNEELPAF